MYCFTCLRYKFISGFYNLEGIDINGVVDNYDQFDKLEKLRELRHVYLSNVADKYKSNKYYLQVLKEESSDSRLTNFLCNLRLYAQNRNYQLRHELYVSRLDRVKLEESIKNQSIEEIKQKLIEFYQLDYQTRKNYLREPKKERNFFDELHGLCFDTVTRPEDDEPYCIANSDSNPFDVGGIDYYVKSKKIILDK